MKTYELTYIISPEITGEEAKLTSEQVNSFIQNSEGTILKSENPAAKTLSFPIQKMSSGYFVFSEFEIEPEKIKDIEKKLQVNNKILRCMLITKKPVKIKKERRGKKSGESLMGRFDEPVTIPPKADLGGEAEKKQPPKKAELEDIEKKLDEILGE